MKTHSQPSSDGTTREIKRLRELSYSNTVTEIQRFTDPTTTKDVVRKHNLQIFNKIANSDEPTQAPFSDFNEDADLPLTNFTFLN